MPQPLSNDLRLCLIDFVEEGHSMTKHCRIINLTILPLFF